MQHDVISPIEIEIDVASTEGIILLLLTALCSYCVCSSSSYVFVKPPSREYLIREKNQQLWKIYIRELFQS